MAGPWIGGDTLQLLTQALCIGTWDGDELRLDTRRDNQRHGGYSLSASGVSSLRNVDLPSRAMRRGPDHSSGLVANA